MPARGDEHEIGKADAGRQACGQRVRLEVIDGDEGLAARERHPLARHQADENAADEARTRRGRHAIEILGRDFGPRERAGDKRVDDLDMGARRNLGHNAPERRVRGDLAHHFVGKDFAGAIGSQPHDRRRRFVAGCLNAENAHV